MCKEAKSGTHILEKNQYIEIDPEITISSINKHGYEDSYYR